MTRGRYQVTQPDNNETNITPPTPAEIQQQKLRSAIAQINDGGLIMHTEGTLQGPVQYIDVSLRPERIINQETDGKQFNDALEQLQALLTAKIKGADTPLITVSVADQTYQMSEYRWGPVANNNNVSTRLWSPKASHYDQPDKIVPEEEMKQKLTQAKAITISFPIPLQHPANAAAVSQMTRQILNNLRSEFINHNGRA